MNSIIRASLASRSCCTVSVGRHDVLAPPHATTDGVVAETGTKAVLAETASQRIVAVLAIERVVAVIAG